MRVLLDLTLRDQSFSLALEEVILRVLAQGTVPPTLRIWRSPRCVVIGHSQRPEEEADLVACRRFRIPVLRRPSGGGAVYLHPGSLNFSLFLPLSGPWTGVRSSQALVAGLVAKEVRASFGLAAEVRDGGVVYVDERKISGSAQLRRHALLHHGTMLLWGDEVPMEEVLLALGPAYSPSGTPSRPAPVGDLSSLLGRPVAIEEGIRALLRAFRHLGALSLEELTLREWALASASSRQDACPTGDRQEACPTGDRQDACPTWAETYRDGLGPYPK
jgi:lipoate-protein ligase A